jgi:rhodanese-related sulfurtransferase
MSRELPAYAPLSPTAAAEWLKQDGHAAAPLLLDVRTADEHELSRIEGSLNVDVYDGNFVAHLDQLDRGRQYLVYCSNGGRSAWAVEFMRQRKFSAAHDLLGGFGAWVAAGLPTEAGED